jgi:hypothetical protein
MTQLQAARAEELSSGFKGEVLLPGDDAYENARQIWNAMVDKRPAVIARCAAVSDVVRAVNFARDNGLLLAVRGGGHNIAGSALCDDGLRLLSPPRERGSGLHLPHRGSGCHTRTS